MISWLSRMEGVVMGNGVEHSTNIPHFAKLSKLSVLPVVTNPTW